MDCFLETRQDIPTTFVLNWNSTVVRLWSMGASTEARSLQLCHQLLQSNSRDLLLEENLQCDSLPDDRPATTLPPEFQNGNCNDRWNGFGTSLGSQIISMSTYMPSMTPNMAQKEWDDHQYIYNCINWAISLSPAETKNAAQDRSYWK